MSKSCILGTDRENIRLRGYSLHTEQTHLHWIYHFVQFNSRKQPNGLHAADIKSLQAG
ncbi:phage integrase N-terminal SAM-like domain-containing protein [Rheinheimera aquimaris]|uniref:phage integrase N-terminal SAM-like domain-containing protein n=1 Tax=Rheinheimera aquimaris TaxID=412437 RepID=UPI001CFF742A|nr:phage integrase N-terminal SAM-like domain-containing protein [Rheinheimera aquimaris]